MAKPVVPVGRALRVPSGFTIGAAVAVFDGYELPLVVTLLGVTVARARVTARGVALLVSTGTYPDEQAENFLRAVAVLMRRARTAERGLADEAEKDGRPA